MIDQPKVLVILPYVPTSIRIRTFNMLSMMSTRFRITLICLEDETDADYDQFPIDRIITIANRNKINRLLRCLWAVLNLKPLTYWFYYSGQVNQILRNLNLESFDFVYIERLPIQELELKYARRIVFDCVDCFTRQVNLLRKSSRLGLRKSLYFYDELVIRKYEAACCNRADLVLVSASREIPELKAIGVTREINEISHLRFNTDSNVIPMERREKIVSFHGKMSYQPNTLALVELDVIAKRVASLGYRTLVVGKGGDAYSHKYPSISFTGWVESVFDYICSVTVAVFPVTVSVGIPNKVIESLSCGIPVFVTPELASGLRHIDTVLGKVIFSVEANEMADSIAIVLESGALLHSDIAEVATNYVRKYYDNDSVDQKMLKLHGFEVEEPILVK